MNFIVILLLGTIALVSGCKSTRGTTADSSAAAVFSTPRTTNSFAIITPTNSPAGFRQYDRAIAATIERRWFDLLDSFSYDGFKRGRVVLQLRLHSDGRVTDVKVVERTVSPLLSLLCQKAVLDPAPYPAWPSGMREMVERDDREIQFSFHFYESPAATSGKR